MTSGAWLLAHFAYTATLLDGCAALPGESRGLVANRIVETAIVRNGSPVVVFESGLGARLETWSTVFTAVAQDTTVFAYDRPGYGGSESPSTPRDGAHVVDELRAVLAANGLPPPYLLVGHSLGGLYVQYFARRYPTEVAGVVLVDATHPEQFRGDGSPDHWPAWYRTLFGIWSSGIAHEEFAAADATGQAVLALPPFDRGPAVVLAAREPNLPDTPVVRDARRKREDICLLYTSDAADE